MEVSFKLSLKKYLMLSVPKVQLQYSAYKEPLATSKQAASYTKDSTVYLFFGNTEQYSHWTSLTRCQTMEPHAAIS